jgi:hypothetical protein
MIKLITPPALLLTTALFAIFSAYAFLIWSIEGSLPLLFGGALSVVTTYGVAMMRPWSQYLVYLLTAGFFAKLGLSLYSGWTSGFFSFQYGSMRAIALSLGPTAMMALLSILCCWLVYRYFHRIEQPAAIA